MSSPPGADGAAAPAMSVDTPILVLGLAGLSMHHGALGIVRSAGRLGVPVFIAHPVGKSPIERSRYCTGSLRFAADDGDDGRLAALREFAGGLGRPILIPVDDAGAMFVEDHAEALAEHFRFPRQPAGLVRSLASKREMHALCRRHGVPTPSVECPQSEGDVARYAETALFPVVAKRIDASLPCDPSAPSVSIAQTGEELLSAYRLMESSQAPNVLLQEYIPGTPEAIWMFNGYFDAQSECLVSFTGQKIRQSPPDTGATTLGVCRVNGTVEEATRHLMKALGYRGALDLGFRFDARDGQYKLLDVNPRLGATFRLFVGSNGMDVLRALYLDLTGQAVPATAQREDRRWLVEPLDVRSSVTYLRRRDLTLGGWVRSFRGVQEAAWWASDDPRPFLAVTKSLSRGLARRLLVRR